MNCARARGLLEVRLLLRGLQAPVNQNLKKIMMNYVKYCQKFFLPIVQFKEG